MKNHSDEKPYHCPRCRYRSKWKWDVVKHLKRCGGGTIKDVIDSTNKSADVKMELLENNSVVVGESAPTTYTEANILETIERERSKSPSSVSKAGLICSKFYCMQCPFIGNSPAELKRHSRVHSDQKPFICKTCGYRSKWKCDLKKHVRNYNHEPTVDFDASPAKDNSRTESAVNTQSNGEEALYRCHQCDYSTSKKETLDIHMKIHVPAGLMRVSQGKKYKCKQCGVVSVDLLSFLQHKVRHATDISAAKMPPSMVPYNTSLLNQQQCSGMYDHIIPLSLPVAKSTPFLNTRMSVKEEEVVVVQGVTLRVTRRRNKKVYNCPKCPFTHNNVGNATRHVRQHGSKHKHTCNRCDYSVDQKRYLTNHMNTVHGPENVQSAMGGSVIVKNQQSSVKRCIKKLITGTRGACIKKYKSVAMQLKNIIKTVKAGKKSVAKLFMCELCHYSTGNKRSILLHRYSHGTTKQLVMSPQSQKNKIHLEKLYCIICPYSSVKPALLQRHSRLHGASNKHTCNICNFSVNKIEHLVQHVSLHTHHLAAEVRRQALASGKTTLCGGVSDLLKYDINRETSPPSKSASSCENCPYKYADKNNKTLHKQRHLVEEKYPCAYSDFSTSVKTENDAHVKLHEPSSEFNNDSIKHLVNHGQRFPADVDPMKEEECNKKKNVHHLKTAQAQQQAC